MRTNVVGIMTGMVVRVVGIMVMKIGERVMDVLIGCLRGWIR